MKKSCLIFLLLFLLVGVGYFLFIHRYLAWLPSLIFSLFGAISILLIYSAFTQLWTTRKKVRALRRAAEAQPLAEGDLAAAVGTLQVEGPALFSPIFGKECALYDYEVYLETRSQSDSKAMRDHLYTGIAMTRCSIQGLQGKIRLLGFPDLQHFPELQSIATEDFGRFQEYARTTAPEKMLGFQKVKLFDEFVNLLQDVDGVLKKDWLLKEIPQGGAEIHMAEKAVTLGQQVVAFGIYSEEKRGIVTQAGAFGMMNELYAGTPEKVEKLIRGNAVFLLIFALVWFSFMNGIMLLIPHAHPQ